MHRLLLRAPHVTSPVAGDSQQLTPTPRRCFVKVGYALLVFVSARHSIFPAAAAGQICMHAPRGHPGHLPAAELPSAVAGH